MSDTNTDLDLTFLYEVADGSDEFIVESIDAFLEQTPILLDEVITAVNNSEWDVAARSAHSLKANLGFFGMLNSQALLMEIESACKAGGRDPEDIKGKYNRLTGVIDTSFAKLNEIKAEKAADI